MNRLCYIFIFSPLISLSQSLVLNSGFEDINVCTEFRVECAPEAWISSANGFANYFRDRNRAHKSLNCMAIEAGNFIHENRRSFIRTPLVCGMRSGAVYQIEMYVKSAHDVFDSLGILFTETDPLFDNTPVHLRQASIYFNPFVDPLEFRDSSWYKVNLTYTATGHERFFAIGYFARNEYLGEKAHPMENRYFVFVDDVYLFPQSPNESICANYKERKEDIYDENERHQMLEKKIAHYKKNPPLPTQLMSNQHLRVDTLVLPDIVFASGKSELQEPAFTVLDTFVGRLRTVAVDSVVIEGHTDNTGTADLNRSLSLERAEAVKKYFLGRLHSVSIYTRGWADTRPVAGNETAAGRQLNRRVEVLLYIRE